MNRFTRRLAFVLVLGTAGAPVACSDDDRSRPSSSPASPASPASAGSVTLPELPVPRTEVVGAAWQGGLVVAGGLTADGGASPLVHTFEPDTRGWRAAPPLPVPLHHAGMAAAGGRLYVAGGYTNGPGQPWVPQAALRSIGPGEEAWRDEPPMPAGARGALGLAATGRLVVATGGESGGRPLGTTEVYDVDTRTWRAGPDLSVPREHLAVAARGTRVFAIAGRAAGKGNFTTVESFDPASDQEWKDEPDVRHARGGIGAASVGGRLCVAGGEEPAGTIASVECLDEGQWTAVGKLARPRHGLAVMALAGRLHVVSGGEQPGLFVSGAHEVLDV